MATDQLQCTQSDFTLKSCTCKDKTYFVLILVKTHSLQLVKAIQVSNFKVEVTSDMVYIIYYPIQG